MTFYRAIKSGTSFEAATPDDEGIGLEDLHKPEEDAIRLFSESDANVLVMGGLSGTGKTHLLRRLQRALGFDFVDFHSVGHRTSQVDQLGAAAVAQAILDARILPAKSKEVLILDEGMNGLTTTKSTPGHGMNDVVNNLLKRYSKLIICGGGPQYTSEEQTEMMVAALPRGIEVATHPFPLRTLNFRQTADLIQRAKLGIYQHEDPTGKLLPREIAELIAAAQLQYFRLLKQTITVARILSEPDLRIESLRSSIRDTIMPDDSFESEWNRQRSAFEGIRETLADMLKQVI